MIDTSNNNYSEDFENQIDLRELFNVIFQGKWVIITITSVVSICAVIYSLSLPNIYQSKALLVPVTSSNGVSGSLGNYAGLAGLAGISLPSGVDESNTTQAKVKLAL